MAVVSSDVVATAASVVGTMLLLNAIAAILALYPRHRSGAGRGMLSQSAIQVRVEAARGDKGR